MKYMLQVYFDGAAARLERLPEAERKAIVDEYKAFFQAPEVKDGNQLQPPATATTVRLHEGETVPTSGPYSGASEPLGGYYLVEAVDIDAAVALAARIPAARMGGAVEIRPIVHSEEPAG
ncbi:MAG TPA: YciI family protein [Streptosporangiaceae bacterium]